jgi:hypothetical protein
MNKDITIELRNTRNSKGQIHGYQEWYTTSGKLCYRGEYNNGKVIAYHEFHGGIKTLIYIK